MNQFSVKSISRLVTDICFFYFGTCFTFCFFVNVRNLCWASTSCRSPELGRLLDVLGEGGEERVLVLGQEGGGGGGLAGGGRWEEVWRLEGEGVEGELVWQGQAGQWRVREQRLLFGGEGWVTTKTITHQHRHPQPPGAEPGPKTFKSFLLYCLLGLVSMILKPNLNLNIEFSITQGEVRSARTWVGVKLSMLARCSLSGADK